MIELIMAGAAQSPIVTEGIDGEVKSALLMLLARMVNDFEAAKSLLLNGLAEQFYMPLRDTVEWAGLIMLFLTNDELALRWMSDVSQYQPGSVRGLLEQQGYALPEHELYSKLSPFAHCNLYGAITQVVEDQVGDDSALRTYHFGGYNNSQWSEVEVRLLISVLWLMLRGSVSAAVKSFDGDFESWWLRVIGLKDRVLEGGVRFTEQDTDAPRVSETQVSVELKIFDHALLDPRSKVDPR